ncbi:YfeK family protein [Ideonella livida]|uniref:DUF5329 domain-containing protein n=1 Tax=Ideonella livida TaxID=2707176 RepID=A0A7C9PI77_9BURK|nr:DUF5329 domain-containing protein [Ideonella livida]NDY92448.1 DUF5329 domain-containing protein [Ideonella livida]
MTPYRHRRLLPCLSSAWRGLPALALAALAALCSAGPAGAAPSAAPVRAEIEALLARLQSSGCQFQRNGTWHEAPQAREHLLRKLAAVEERTTVRSTEQFIELAASRSSLSGQAYQVRCGTTPAQNSQPWLSRELAALRGETRNRP